MKAFFFLALAIGLLGCKPTPNRGLKPTNAADEVRQLSNDVMKLGLDMEKELQKEFRAQPAARKPKRQGQYLP